ncbi:unnamed protein product [Toxocara canis]|uniref:Secreted protein n=1 Tax=Toxocara canis TaxID=6265 RepID=A0A183TZK4_TOXCA|nr:unnamed protein product [Toxocara canis]
MLSFDVSCGAVRRSSTAGNIGFGKAEEGITSLYVLSKCLCLRSCTRIAVVEKQGFGRIRHRKLALARRVMRQLQPCVCMCVRRVV